MRIAVLLLAALAAFAAHAGEVQVAVAANMAGPIQKIAAAFRRDTGHEAVVAIGSTGKFHAQIANGAPFEVLLAADQETPRKLENEGLARAGTRFTYAVGKLVLWSDKEGVVDARGDVLRHAPRGRIAIADPRVAPYGAAAVEALKNLGVLEAWQPHIVQGENIAQTFQYVASGNAWLGFIALSQVAEGGRVARGSGWVVPASLYSPIQQDAVLLERGANNPAAAAFLNYMRGNAAKAILRTSGYGF